MRIMLFILFIFYSFSSTSQNLKNLNKDRSLKEFKLGDDFSKWESQCFYEKGDGNAKAKIYKFTGNTGVILDSFIIDKIELTFLKSKLVEIDVELKKWKLPTSKDSVAYICDKKLNEISKRFIALYGKPVGYHPVDFDLLWSGDDYWETKSTRLNIGVRAFPFATGFVEIELDDQAYYDHKIDYLINNQ